MKIIEAYALSCGLKISKPFILDKFFPLDFDKYIVIHPFAEPAKSYDYWNDVVDTIKPALDKLDIKIVQIGSNGEKNLNNCFNLQGKTTINQTAYLLKNALCLAGIDGFSAHVAGALGIKSVTLYSNSNPENTGQYWGEENNRITLIGDRKGAKTSYSMEESPKTINNIYPEKVARAICKLMDIELDFPFETVYIGRNYASDPITVFPCSSFVQHNPSFLPELRMDLHFDENILSQQLERGRAVIVTDKPISLELLQRYKAQIAGFVYLLKQEDHPDFVKKVKKLGLNLFCFSHLSEVELEAKKINYYDAIKVSLVARAEPNDALKIKNLNDTYYTSRQNIFSNGQLFNSQEAFARKIPSQHKVSQTIDSEEFWRQLEDFRILKKVA